MTATAALELHRWLQRHDHMDASDDIAQFVREVKGRNRSETIAHSLGIAGSGLFLVALPLPSLAQWGFLALILGSLAGVLVLKFIAPPRGNLTRQPAHDRQHWRMEMLRQAKILRLSLLWYFLPLLPGFALMFCWISTISFLVCALFAAVLAAAYAVGIWLNVKGAMELERRAASLGREQANQSLQADG